MNLIGSNIHFHLDVCFLRSVIVFGSTAFHFFSKQNINLEQLGGFWRKGADFSFSVLAAIIRAVG